MELRHTALHLDHFISNLVSSIMSPFATMFVLKQIENWLIFAAFYVSLFFFKTKCVNVRKKVENHCLIASLIIWMTIYVLRIIMIKTDALNLVITNSSGPAIFLLHTGLVCVLKSYIKLKNKYVLTEFHYWLNENYYRNNINQK